MLWIGPKHVVVVTGGADGIGRAVAVECLNRGASVAIVDVRQSALDNTKTALAPLCTRPGQLFEGYQCDVRDRAAVNKLAAAVVARFGKVSVLLNLAGIIGGATMDTCSYEEWDKVIGVNVNGVMTCCKEFLPYLVNEPKACIANMSSLDGLIGMPGALAYIASKHAVTGFSRALQMELAILHPNVSVTCIHPGAVSTNIIDNNSASLVPTALIPKGVEVPKGMLLTAEQISNRFKAIGSTTPSAAAKQIINGIWWGRTRILVGNDAVILDLIHRVAPSLFHSKYFFYPVLVTVCVGVRFIGRKIILGGALGLALYDTFDSVPTHAVFKWFFVQVPPTRRAASRVKRPATCVCVCVCKRGYLINPFLLRVHGLGVWRLGNELDPRHRGRRLGEHARVRKGRHRLLHERLDARPAHDAHDNRFVHEQRQHDGSLELRLKAADGRPPRRLAADACLVRKTLGALGHNAHGTKARIAARGHEHFKKHGASSGFVDQRTAARALPCARNRFADFRTFAPRQRLPRLMLLLLLRRRRRRRGLFVNHVAARLCKARGMHGNALARRRRLGYGSRRLGYGSRRRLGSGRRRLACSTVVSLRRRGRRRRLAGLGEGGGSRSSATACSRCRCGLMGAKIENGAHVAELGNTAQAQRLGIHVVLQNDARVEARVDQRAPIRGHRILGQAARAQKLCARLQLGVGFGGFHDWRRGRCRVHGVVSAGGQILRHIFLYL